MQLTIKMRKLSRNVWVKLHFTPPPPPPHNLDKISKERCLNEYFRIWLTLSVSTKGRNRCETLNCDESAYWKCFVQIKWSEVWALMPVWSGMWWLTPSRREASNVHGHGQICYELEVRLQQSYLGIYWHNTHFKFIILVYFLLNVYHMY